VLESNPPQDAHGRDLSEPPDMPPCARKQVRLLGVFFRAQGGGGRLTRQQGPPSLLCAAWDYQPDGGPSGLGWGCVGAHGGGGNQRAPLAELGRWRGPTPPPQLGPMGASDCPLGGDPHSSRTHTVLVCAARGGRAAGVCAYLSTAAVGCAR